jgi:predicted AlkP superfamily phosphohydrolase/phosphomutase
MSVNEYAVFIIGLDGATFDLMLPWIAEGRLPTLGRLVGQGAWSRLESTIPPITPCAWSSFLTGKNPGKHGLFDFVQPLPGSHRMVFTNASFRQGESLWGCMSRHGKRVGVVNVPMTYPPEEVNGYLISGLDTPSERSKFMYPETLQQELHHAGIDYRVDIQHLGNMRSDTRRDQNLERLRDLETGHTKALRHLRKRYPSQFTMIVYTATDQVQHHFWHYMDPRHDKHDAEGAERYKNAIRDVYILLDGLIAEALKDIGSDTVVALMSDHGFGPTTSLRVRLNQALERAGLLAFAREGSAARAFRFLAGWADGLLRSTLSNRAKRLLAGLFPRLRVWFEGLDEARLDWEKTRAYTHEAYRSCPAVWINQGGQQGVELEEALSQVEQSLLSLRDPQTGQPVISKVFRTRDLYQGPFLDRAPDLIPSWWDDGFLLEQSVPGGRGAPDVERSTAPIRGGVEFAASHRLDGVFAIHGGPVKRGYSFEGARIIDVAPTVLYLMGLPIPDDMDGKPLVEALEPAFVAANPPRFERKAAEKPPVSLAPAAFSKQEAELIEERLKALGYVE